MKFHWKPKLGVHSVLWEEAQVTNGMDPDFHRRDLADAIEAGAHPSWELGIQVFEDNEDQTFEGIDLLDPTKLVPEELAPVRPIGLMTLNGNSSNFFAETEQVAFHPGHLVRGIEVTNDPLLQDRLFSYLDTQISRLGGPNLAQLPINRPRAAVNDMHRDGMHQTAVHSGVAPYHPNTLDGNNPFPADEPARPVIDHPEPVAASVKERASRASFEDHYSQARLFWRSMSGVEKEHIAQAYTFELGKCWEQAVRERQLQALANIDTRLCAVVAEGLGLPAPRPTVKHAGVRPSPALFQIGQEWPLDGRQIGVVVGADPDEKDLLAVVTAIDDAGMVPLIVAPHGGPVGRSGRLVAHRTYLTARSVEFDAVLVAGNTPPAPDARPGLDAKAAAPAPAGTDPRVHLLLGEVFRQAKAIGAWDARGRVLADAGLPQGAPGVIAGKSPSAVVEQVTTLLRSHRVWERFPVSVRI